MAHPETGGSGNVIDNVNQLSFKKAFLTTGSKGIKFKSTTNERITATQSFARDDKTPVIVFSKDDVSQGNVCPNCWGYRISCTGVRIGQYTEGLLNHFLT